MRRKTIGAVISITLMMIGSSLAQTAQIPATPAGKQLAEQEAFAGLDKDLDRLVKANEFAGAVLVAKNGQPVFRKAYGLASREYDVPNRVDTRFNLGSINKIFTQIAIGQLIKQGKLSLDETIGKHLPDYPNNQARQSVTIKHLLDMSSGIGDIFNEKYRSTPKDRIRTNEDYLLLFAGEPLAFEPGTRQQYSNGGYIVLGAIIEKVSGQNYYDYVREHIFKPTGMEQTDYFQADDIVPNCASGYTRQAEGGAKDAPLRNNFYTRPARGSSAGGGYSTIDDMLKFARALESGELVMPNFRAPARASASPNRPPGNGGLGIGGGAPGINAELETNVAGVYTIIVLSNLDPPSAGAVARQIRTRLSPGAN